MKNRYFLVFWLILFSVVTSHAQNGEIRGFVYEKDNSEPSIYTSVFLSGTTLGGQTNLDGFFNISKIPPGNYTLMVTSVGFDTLKMAIEVKAGDMLTKKLYITKSTIEMK